MLHGELRVELIVDFVACGFAGTGYKHVIDVDKYDNSKSLVVVDRRVAIAYAIAERYDVFAETHIPESWRLFQAVEGFIEA